jgi:hypothetical protein
MYNVVGENTNNRRYTHNTGSFNSQVALAPGLRMIIGFVLAAKRVESPRLSAKTQRGQ